MTIKFTLNNNKVEAQVGETIWQVAKRNNIEIPHMCWQDESGYRADGNCRTCMVEITGERTLAASCVRTPNEGMEVNTNSARAEKARKTVFELLGTDQPKKDVAHESTSKFWHWADKLNIELDKFPTSQKPKLDASHPAMRVNLDSCINCNLCVMACREVQVNDVINVSGRGSKAHISFDIDDPMGQSTCVGCGECVQACPTGALMPATQVNELQHFIGTADKVVNSSCPFCGVGCLTAIHIKDNKILKVDGRDGPANNKRLCVKGRFGMDYASHNNRLNVPLIRRDDAPAKSWDMYIPDEDFSKYFREASWEEAMEKATSGFLKLKQKYGKYSLVGFGSAKGSNEEAYLFQKLVRTGFGTNNVDHCTRLCHASSVAALLEGISSGAVSNPFNDAEKAECIVIIGSRPSWNHPVAGTYIKQAVKKGTKLIVMDPRGQDLVRHAHLHLQFKAGTDVPMLKAIIKIIIDNDWVNHDFIKKRVNGYDQIVASAKEYSVEQMSKSCGISTDDLYETARVYSSRKSIIMWGMGVSQHVHGTDNNRCLITLAMITGNIGKEGTGLHPLRGQNNVQGASDVGLIPMMYPDYKRVDNPDFQEKFEKYWGQKLDNKPGLTVVEVINAILEDEVRGLYVMGENPAMSDPDTQHTRQALAHLEHLVVQEIFMTETAMFADVILPASAFPEKSGTFSNTNRTVQMVRPALEMPGQARQDLEILIEMGQRLGLDWKYENGAKDVFTEMTQVMESIAGMSWDRLDKADSITYPCTTPEDPGQPVIFKDVFPTPTGFAQLVPTDLVPPSELPDTEYPLILTTGRLLEHWHTGAMTRRATVLDAIEPEAIVHIHPVTISKLGLEAGEFANVHTRRGHLKLKVRSDRDVALDMVFVPFCFAEAPANILTNPKLDPFGKIPEFKFCAARVEKSKSNSQIV